MFQQLPNGAPQRFLRDALPCSVNGGDPLEVDRGFALRRVVQNFKFRMIDDQSAAFGCLGLAIYNNVLVGGEGFRDKGHVEPPQRQRGGEPLQAFQSCHAALIRRGYRHNDEGAAGTGSFQLDIRDDALKAKRGPRFPEAVRPTVESGAVFITERKMRQHIPDGEEPAFDEGFDEPFVRHSQGFQGRVEGHAGRSDFHGLRAKQPERLVPARGIGRRRLGDGGKPGRLGFRKTSGPASGPRDGGGLHAARGFPFLAGLAQAEAELEFLLELLVAFLLGWS